MKRLAFGAGVFGVAALCAALVVVFFREDAQRGAEVLGQRAALEAFATASLRRAIEDGWTRGVSGLDDAVADPLLDDERLLLVSDGRQVLPRRARGAVEGVVEAQRRMVAGEVVPTGDAPALERRRFVAALVRALETHADAQVETSVRTLLSHRQHYQLSVSDELATLLAVVELLQTRARPAASLLRGALRDGFGPGLPGAQRLVLGAVDTLAPAEVDRLCALVQQQSVRANVPADDFVHRCVAVRSAEPVPLEAGPGLSFVSGFALRGGGDVRGVRVDVERLVAVDEAAMRERGLLERSDTLRLATRAGPVNALAVEVESPRWLESAQARRLALSLKLGLLAVALTLGVALALAVRGLSRREAALVAAKAELVSTVSHELRTPLASLRVMAEALDRKLEGHADVKQWPARIVAEVDGLSALVENILAFNRLEQGRGVVRPEPFHAEVLEGWLRADAPEVEVTVAGTTGLVLPADATWLRVAFANLARNAGRYTSSARATLAVTATVEGAVVHFDVKDTGIGIDPSQWERVFEAFHRLRDGKGRGGGGSGLGLAIVRRVAEAHGGSVRVVSSSSAGTTFRLSLPLNG